MVINSEKHSCATFYDSIMKKKDKFQIAEYCKIKNSSALKNLFTYRNPLKAHYGIGDTLGNMF